MKDEDKQPTQKEIDDYWERALDFTELKLLESMRNEVIASDDPTIFIEYQQNIIERLTEENNKLRTANKKLKKMFSDARKIYAKKGHEEAVRFLKLGRGKHGRIADPFDIMEEYVDCLKTGCSKMQAVNYIMMIHGLASSGSTIKYLRRALIEIKKHSKNPEKFKGLIPGNPTDTIPGK